MPLGTQVTVAVWAMTGLSLAMVGLRLYTRVRIVKFVGTEDYLFGLTGLFLLAFAATLHVSVHYGLGSSLWGLSLDNTSNAIFWSYVANTFAVTGNAMAKLSMGFFLLRVVQVRAQKAALWVLIIVTAGTSIALVVMLWNQTTPRKASWDPLRTPGVWNIQIQPMSIGLGGWSSACDFFFAIFPWMFIWSLRMPRREKIMLASSMSLGVIAGACGVVRTVVLSRLQVTDYTLNFAPYFIWAGAEIAVAMVCLAVPTLRPLYLRNHGSTTIDYTARAHAYGDGSDPELPRFTMLSDTKSPITPQTPSSEQICFPEKAASVLGVRGEATQPPSTTPRAAIIRDSSSSHTMVEQWHQPNTTANVSAPILYTTPPSPDNDDPEADIKPLACKAEVHQVIRPPSSVYTKRSNRSDSVDDILGLYNSERSRSRGAASTQSRTRYPPDDVDSGSTLNCQTEDLPTFESAVCSINTADAADSFHHPQDTDMPTLGRKGVCMTLRELENWPLRN
ncbi:hypothetical protein V8F20_001531 [Naviculisporaceae sp. PSN 640]